MIHYRRILVSIDLQEDASELIIRKAESVKKANEANGIVELFFVHAVESFDVLGTGYNFPSTSNIEAEIMKQHENKLKKLMKDHHFSSHQLIVRQGHPGFVITEVSKEINADLIIVGNHARHGLNLLFNGETSNNIIHHTACDVLAVKLPD